MQVGARALFSSFRILGASSCLRFRHGLSTTMGTFSASRNSGPRQFIGARATKIQGMGELLKPESGWLASRFYSDSDAPLYPWDFPEAFANFGKTISVTSDIEEVYACFRGMFEVARFQRVSDIGIKDGKRFPRHMWEDKHRILADNFFDAFKLCASNLKVQDALGTPITFDLKVPYSFVFEFKENGGMFLLFKINGPFGEAAATMVKEKQDNQELAKYTCLGVWVVGDPVRTIKIITKDSQGC